MSDTEYLGNDPVNGRQDPWLELCRKSGINPQEVQLIYGRYDAYREYTEEKTGASIPLAQWFHFYQLEKSSEGLQVNVSAEDCSAEGDAVNETCMQHPADFLRALQAYGMSRRR